MKKNNYDLLHEKKYVQYHEVSLENAFEFKKKKDIIGTVKFYDEKVVSVIMKKNLDKKFQKILNLMIETEDNEEPDGLMLCLNEAEKFKKEINNKYAKLLSNQQKAFNLKKIEVIENDLKKKLMAYQFQQMVYAKNNFQDEREEQEEEKEERHRRR